MPWYYCSDVRHTAPTPHHTPWALYTTPYAEHVCPSCRTATTPAHNAVFFDNSLVHGYKLAWHEVAGQLQLKVLIRNHGRWIGILLGADSKLAHDV